MNPGGGGLAVLSRRGRVALRELLVAATAAAGRKSDIDELSKLVAAAPAHALPEAASLHRVTGSTLRGLDGVSGLSRDVTAPMMARSQESSLHHLLVVGALSEIGAELDRDQLCWAVIKGPVAAALLYPEAGDRTYADLDLLVDRRHFPLAVRTLEDLGYRHAIRNWALAEEMLAGQIVMSGRSVVVDLHWHLHYSRRDRRPFSLDPGAMLERSRRVQVSAVETPTLDPVDTLLTLAFHAARSDGHRLIWLKDVERMMSIEQPDLDELIRRSREYGCAPPVGLILRRAKELLRADVPDETIDAILPWSLRAADRVAVSLAHPIQLHERDTITRVLTRSIRSSAAASLGSLPQRAAQSVRRRVRPPPENESDDADEKASYLRAVSTSVP